jgi:hypothetical protein
VVGELAARHALPKEVVDSVTERTGGVPLFVEEVTRLLLERGEQGGIQAIPPTLQQSLTARLDRLGPAREVAQIGAVIGRGFSYDLLRAVAGTEDTLLQTALERLAEADILLVQGLPPESDYRFKHALMQDAAYGTLLRSRRQQLHNRISATLESHFPEIVEMQPELLARHCTEAGLVEKAVGHWIKAGQQAIARAAMTEAVAQLRKGLDLLSSVPNSTARQEQELDLQIALGNALIATKGYAAPESGEAFGRARQLCKQLNRPAQLGRVLVGQWHFRLVRGELEQAKHHAEEIRHLGEALNDVMWTCFGSTYSGATHFFLGRFTDARAYEESALSLWDPTYRAFATAAVDPYVVMRMRLSRTLLCLGYVDQANSRREEALAEAQRLSPSTAAWALTVAWPSDWAMDEGAKSAARMLRSAEELLAIADKHDFSYFSPIGNIMCGWGLGTVGRSSEGIPLFLQGLTILRATGCNLVLPFYLTMFAEVYGKAAQPDTK